MLPQTFSAVLEKSPNRGGWTYLVWSKSAEFFKTKGLVKVSGTIDGKKFAGSFMAMGNGVHMLPVKTEIREAIGKEKGQRVKVVIQKRVK